MLINDAVVTDADVTDVAVVITDTQPSLIRMIANLAATAGVPGQVNE